MLQTPPTFSAVKVGGVTAHRAARRGEPLEIAAREVTVHALTADEWDAPQLRVAMTVSTGTYVRAIARDLGLALGCGGHVVEMRRVGIGPVTVDDAHTPQALESAFTAGTGWDLATPLIRFFEHWPRVIPSAAPARPDPERASGARLPGRQRTRGDARDQVDRRRARGRRACGR